MATEFKLSYTAADINARLGKIDNLADKSELPTKLSDLTNDSGFATKNYVQDYAQPVGDYALKSEIPEEVQSDWLQTDETASDFIKNKPVEMTNDDALNLLAELSVVEPITNENGAIYTNENGAIFTI